MADRTPAEAAAASYCLDWEVVRSSQDGYGLVNPETLGEKTTSAELRFRYIDISSVNNGAINWTEVETLRFADAPSRARRIVRPGDTIISTVRPLLESHAYADWREPDWHVCSTGFAVLRCRDGLVASFVKHLPFAEQVTRQLVAWQCGTNYPAVNERDIRNLRLPAPPPEEQAAIARILDTVDIAIERTRDAIARARELRRALMQELLPPWIGFRHVDTDDIPKGVVAIERGMDVADVLNGSTPSRPEGRYWRNGTIPWLATGKVHDRVIREPEECVTEAALKECSISLLPRGTVLVVYPRFFGPLGELVSIG